MGFLKVLKGIGDDFTGTSARKSKAVDVAEKLYSMGIQDPDTINNAVQNYVQTGDFKIPEFKHSITGQNPDLNPIRLGPRYASFDEASGSVTPLAGAQGARHLTTIKAPRPADEMTGKATFYTTSEDGSPKVTKVVPSKTDHFIRVDPKPAPAPKSHTLTPQERADLDTIHVYQSSVAAGGQKGLPVSGEIQKSAVEAAHRLGLPAFEIEQSKPVTGFVEWIRQKAGADPRFETETIRGLGAPPAGATGAPAPAAQPGGQGAAEYLKSIGAKQTPANLEWARQKLGS